MFRFAQTLPGGIAAFIPNRLLCVDELIKTQPVTNHPKAIRSRMVAAFCGEN